MNKLFILLIVILLVGVVFFYYKKYFQSNNKYGTVIILNGPSAAGKTSLQKEFQSLMMHDKKQLWLKLGIDSLFDNSLPEITLENIDFYKNKNNIRWVENTIDNLNNPLVTLFIGEEGEKVIQGMHDSIASYAKNGNNIIVDYIMYNPMWYEQLEEKLKGIPHYWVKLNINLEELEKRETERNTSPKGHARSHYYSIHSNIQYDFELNVSKKFTKELALELKEKLMR